MKQPFILADNQDITRIGILSILNESELTDVIFEVSARTELMEKLVKYPNSIVLLDYTLFDFSDSQMMNMKQRHQQSLWILFSEELSKHFLRQVLHSGQLFGVVMKTDTKDDIIQAITKAFRGEVYLCDTAKQILYEDVPSHRTYDKLTASERLVLYEIAKGKTTKEIAYEQNLSFHTINTHRRNLFRKLEINNIHEATKYALRAGIIDLTEYYI
ncbi:MAG: response regulator transcription factor [Prevotellaceae bacterium]|jgi:DNA-binding NarL/FixJ family response regulator|nr:response regulator transcription factor [Prevotellaceae bacterium]